MKLLNAIILSFLFVVTYVDVFSALTSPTDSVTIRGTYVGEKSQRIIVFEAYENPMNSRMYFPIVEGKFEFRLSHTPIETYMIVPEEDFVDGPMRPIEFFSEDSVVIDLFPASRFDENRVTGGVLNREFQNYYTELKSRFRDPYSKLWRAIEAGELKEDEAIAQGATLKQEERAWQANYIAANPSLVSYYLLKIHMLNNDEEGLAELALHFPSFAQRYPDHRYTQLIREFYHAKAQIETKKRFINFTAEDMEGNRKEMKDLLAEKATLINFWASWCGACIIKSRTMIPVYERFHSHGFDIVNVATERNNTAALQALIAREKQPWTTNLVDLDNKNGVWQRYTVNNFGGLMVLVDGNQNILAVNPNAEEVSEILTRLMR